MHYVAITVLKKQATNKENDMKNEIKEINAKLEELKSFRTESNDFPTMKRGSFTYRKHIAVRSLA